MILDIDSRSTNIRRLAIALRLYSVKDGFMTPSVKQVSEQAKSDVIAALNDPRYDFRTVPGISETTGLTPECVALVLKEIVGLVRESVVPDEHGNVLYTLKSRPRKMQEVVSETLAFLAGTAR